MHKHRQRENELGVYRDAALPTDHSQWLICQFNCFFASLCVVLHVKFFTILLKWQSCFTCRRISTTIKL